MNRVLLKRNIARNLLIYRQLKEILDRFYAADIETILLKGAAFAETVYPHIGLREMEDIDILIRKEDIYRASKVLKNIGYKALKSGEDAFFREGEAAVLDIHTDLWYITGEVEIYRRKRNCSEIGHNGIDRGFEDLWSRAKEIVIEDIRVKILSPEDSLIYIIAHAGILHGEFNETAKRDIRLILEKYRDINWRFIIEMIYRYNLLIPSRYIFSVLDNRGIIPSGVMDMLGQERVSFSKEYIYRSILHMNHFEDKGHILRILFIRGDTNFLKYLIDFLFPSREFIEQRYNISKGSAISTLFYLLRPVGLIYKGLLFSLNYVSVLVRSK